MKYFVILMLCSISVYSQKYEKDYQKVFSDTLRAETEVRLEDGTRVDILTDDYAFEVDWAYKWAEAIGQSLYYAKETDTRPAVLLIIKDKEKDEKYLMRLMTVACSYEIRVWLIYPDFTFEEKECWCSK